MSGLYYLITITKREYGEEFMEFFYRNGAHTLTAALCAGTAQQKTLDMLGIEKTEKVLLGTVVSDSLVRELLHGLMRTMQIDVPGNGIAFTIPLQSIAGGSSLHYLTQGQNKEQEQVKSMEEPRFSLVVAIAQKGSTELVVKAARSAGAGGGTIVHAKGLSEKNAAQFFGMSIASEQEMIFIVAKQKDEQAIMKAVMEAAGPKDSDVVGIFSLPVNNVVGLRSITEE